MNNLNHSRLLAARFFAAALLLGDAGSALAAGADAANPAPAKTSIPWSQIGAKAGADYQGDGLAVSPTAEGARLRCVFQRLEGEATPEGLWLSSTVTNGVSDRFRIVAAEVTRLTCGPRIDSQPPHVGCCKVPALPNTGNVSIDGQTVRFTRPGLVEEYSASMDGVRQDFVVPERPPGAGELAVCLAASGARVEPAAGGAQLVLENSGRKIAYSRLRATDAAGKELTARMEILPLPIRWGEGWGEELVGSNLPTLAVLVNDADAVYPVRIDPTFGDANWIGMGGIPGANAYVFTAVTDGLGNLYIGGQFTVVGDVVANHIAKWNGSSWSALGSGIGGGVSALAVSGDDVYAGGYFTTADGIAATNIAKWDGSSWSALGSGIDGGVSALAASGSDVYAGGNFTTAGGTAATNIAKWDGSSWSALGSGTDGGVSALAASGNEVYAGGYFTSAGGTAATHIAKWDGSSWSALGSGMDGGVSALAVSGSDVYAGGNFTTAGGTAATHIAKWDGSGWSALGLGVNTVVYALAASGGAVYLVSNPSGGMSPPGFVLKWDGNSWSILGQMNGNFSGGSLLPVYALAVSGSDVYAGGFFTRVNDTSASDIARWNGSDWSALGSGMNGIFPYDHARVNAVAASGSEVYAGGDFTTAGGGTAKYVAKWNGSSWSALGSGVGVFAPSVSALAVSGSDLYVGGYFTEAGGSEASSIARWNGSSWSPLGLGMATPFGSSFVNALAVSGSSLYAGGSFTTAGGVAATNIAKWDGSSWTNLGSGLNGRVSALAASGSDLYAGGQFTTAGGSPATNVARWDGSSWSALGVGIASPFGFASVNAVAVLDSDLYVGGQFALAGGIAVTNIAKWDGNNWSALGSGMNGEVHALVVSGGNLYAGGSFTTAGGTPTNGIAKWDGTNWAALGSGIGGANPSVSALAASGSDLYAGGNFTTAGGKASAYVAKAIVNPPVLAIEGDGASGYFIRFSGVPGSAYWLERAPAVSGPWTAIGPQTAPASGLVEFRDLFTPPNQGCYRSVQP